MPSSSTAPGPAPGPTLDEDVGAVRRALAGWARPSSSAATPTAVLPALGPHGMGTFGGTASAIGWRRLPSTYVVCAHDRVPSRALQRRLAARATEIVTLPSRHGPMLTAAARSPGSSR